MKRDIYQKKKKKRTKQDEKSTKMARGKGRLTNEKPEFKARV